MHPHQIIFTQVGVADSPVGATQALRRCLCRAFKLSGPHPKVSKQAVLRRTQTEMGEELTFKPCLVARRRSASAGRQRPAPATGAGRIDQLAKPRTQLWATCERGSHEGLVRGYHSAVQGSLPATATGDKQKGQPV